MLCKAAVMGDIATYRHLLNVTSPQQAKHLGRRVNNFDEAKWTRVVCSVAFHVVYQKFKQCTWLQPMLLETGEKLLAEATADKKWGIGLQKGLTQIPCQWKGSNVLGWALMEVRQLIRAGHDRAGMSFGVAGRSLAGPTADQMPLSSRMATALSLASWDATEYGSEYLTLVEDEKLQVVVLGADPRLPKLDEAWAWGRSLQRQVEGYFPPAYVSIPFAIQDARTLHVLTIPDCSAPGGKPYLAPWSESHSQLWYFTADEELKSYLNGYVLDVDERASGKPVVLVDPMSAGVAWQFLGSGSGPGHIKCLKGVLDVNRNPRNFPDAILCYKQLWNSYGSASHKNQSWHLTVSPYR